MAGVQQCSAQGISYELTYKKVKNINLRVRADGTVAVSAPRGVPRREIEGFVASRAAWIAAAQRRAAARQAQYLVPCTVSPAEAQALFERVSDAVFPLFSSVLGGVRPLVRVRDMKTRWGVCVPARRQITFSLRLAEKPVEAIEYVVLHEYAHFVRADHSPAFWAVVAHHMPDYARRRALLREPPVKNV